MTPHERQRDTDDAHFDADLESAPLVLVKFTGTWCPPCRAMQPTIDALAEERTDLLVLSIDVDEHQLVAQRLGVRSVPTLIAFRNGRPIGSLVGHAPRTAIDKLLT
jgi:thioredoxin 1